MKVVDEQTEPSGSTRNSAAPLPELDQRAPIEFFWTLFHARWIISLITIAFVALGVLYLVIATPIYRSEVALQIEQPTKGIAGFSEVSALLGETTIPSETEMEILRSRSLIGVVVDQLNLQVGSGPRTFPLFGSAIARRYAKKGPSPAWLGLSSYSWGGERIVVERIDVPPRLLGAELTLIARGDGGYELQDDHGVLVRGEVGKPALGGSGDDRVNIFVSDLVARAGTRFVVEKISREAAIDGLRKSLKISEVGKKTGILVVSLERANISKAAAILDGLAAAYVRQNVERKSAEAAKTLEFLETQLPTLKANLEAAEASLKGYQVQKGTLDLSREAQAMLDRTVSIERAVSEAELQRSDLRQRFTDSHPALISLNEKIAKLRSELGGLNGKMRELPGTEIDSARLIRDVKVASELYNLLLNKAQELRVVKSGTIGNVRILDRPTTEGAPVRPLPTVALLMSLVLGLCAGIAAAVTRKSLYAGLDDAEAVERLTGVAVYTTVPRSPRQASLDRARVKDRATILAAIDPTDSAVESIRSLRTSLQFTLVEAPNNVIVITGPTADVGKSFITVNLAHVIASTGKRVLVIDGDLRRGRLHHVFGRERTPGLSDVLSGGATLSEAICSGAVPNLDCMTAGTLPPNPAELLGSDRFERVLKDVAQRYDIVLIDTPPVLPVTDAALIGRLAGTNLLALRAGSHPAREILQSVKRLAQNGVRVNGAVFNDVSGAGARYSRYSYQYRYDARA